jgi:hypothetical protein
VHELYDGRLRYSVECSLDIDFGKVKWLGWCSEGILELFNFLVKIAD